MNHHEPSWTRSLGENIHPDLGNGLERPAAWVSLGMQQEVATWRLVNSGQVETVTRCNVQIQKVEKLNWCVLIRKGWKIRKSKNQHQKTSKSSRNEEQLQLFWAWFKVTISKTSSTIREAMYIFGWNMLEYGTLRRETSNGSVSFTFHGWVFFFWC